MTRPPPLDGPEAPGRRAAHIGGRAPCPRCRASAEAGGAAYCVYVLAERPAPPSGAARRYVGMTNDLGRRLRQHNGELAGGARATRGRGWAVELVVEGFGCMRCAMQAEWRVKRERRAAGRDGPGRWLERCAEVVRDQGGWTRASPHAAEQALAARADLHPRPGAWPACWGWTAMRDGGG